MIWQSRIIYIGLSLLVLFLPWQGTISVFLPDFFRFYKEIILLFLVFIAVKYWRRIPLKKEKIAEKTKNPLFWTGTFLCWTGIAWFLAGGGYYEGISARYLVMGFLFFSILMMLFYEGLMPEKIQKNCGKIFIGSSVASVLFGLWAKYGGGFELLRDFYSTTISSWVPGQTTPLYHLAGDFIRLQGGSSGPVEAAHLWMVAVMLLFLYSKITNYKLRIMNLGLILMLLFGIWETASRGAMLGLVIFLVGWGVVAQRERIFCAKKLFLSAGCLVIALGLWLAFFTSTGEKLWQRAGTSDHITRPIEGIKIALKNPIVGQIGTAGPAARAKNLAEKNDDKAFIAENVFIDWFIQLGMVGLAIGLGFFITLYRKIPRKEKALFWPLVITINFATLFDMTPVSLVYMFVLFYLAISREFSSAPPEGAYSRP